MARHFPHKQSNRPRSADEQCAKPLALLRRIAPSADRLLQRAVLDASRFLDDKPAMTENRTRTSRRTLLGALAVAPATALAGAGAGGAEERVDHGTVQSFALADFSWRGVRHSFRNDGVPVDPAAIAALRDLLLTSTASRLEIVLPAGVINLGSTAGLTAGIQIQRSNVTLRGAGKHSTTVQVTSGYTALPITMVDGVATFDGFGIVVAKFVRGHWTALNSITIADSTLEDLDPRGHGAPNYKTNNAGGTFFAFDVNDIELINFRVVNGKGNGSITINGMADKSGPLNHGCRCINVDILKDASRPGAFAEGDGYNIGNYRDVQIIGGSIIGMQRHALEGGSPGVGMLLDGVFVDQLGQGFSGINPTGYSDVRVVNCHLRNVRSPWYFIDMTDDPGAPAPNMRSLQFIGNLLEWSLAEGTPATSAIRTQTIGFPSTIGRVMIANNIFAGDFYYAWSIGNNDAPNGVVSGNDCSAMVRAQSFLNRVSNTGIAPPAEGTLLFSGNVFPARMSTVRFDANLPEWKNTRFVRQQGNVRGRTLNDASEPHEVGRLVPQSAEWIGGPVPAHGISAVTTITIADATPGDTVKFVPAASWPVGPASELCGCVPANNKVMVWVRNATAAPSPALGPGNYFHIEIERV